MPAERFDQGTKTMRKINEVKGARYILEYDQNIGQFVETLVPYFESSEDTAEIVPFPETVTPEPQPMRKAG
jgi:hypothetical protein